MTPDEFLQKIFITKQILLHNFALPVFLDQIEWSTIWECFFRGGVMNFFQMLRNEAISKPKFIRNYFTDELPCLGTSWKVTDNCNVSPSSWVGSDHVKTLMKTLNNPTL